MCKLTLTCNFDGCDKKFSTKFSLRRHQVTHNPNKEFICLVCFKQFALAQYLKEHTYTHTGQRPYACTHPGCGKTFRQAGKLSLHKKIHSTQIFKIIKVTKQSQKIEETFDNHSTYEESNLSEKNSKKTVEKTQFKPEIEETNDSFPVTLKKSSDEKDILKMQFIIDMRMTDFEFPCNKDKQLFQVAENKFPQQPQRDCAFEESRQLNQQTFKQSLEQSQAPSNEYSILFDQSLKTQPTQSSLENKEIF